MVRTGDHVAGLVDGRGDGTGAADGMGVDEGSAPDGPTLGDDDGWPVGDADGLADAGAAAVLQAARRRVIDSIARDRGVGGIVHPSPVTRQAAVGS